MRPSSDECNGRHSLCGKSCSHLDAITGKTGENTRLQIRRLPSRCLRQTDAGGSASQKPGPGIPEREVAESITFGSFQLAKVCKAMREEIRTRLAEVVHLHTEVAVVWKLKGFSLGGERSLPSWKTTLPACIHIGRNYRKTDDGNVQNARTAHDGMQNSSSTLRQPTATSTDGRNSD